MKHATIIDELSDRLGGQAALGREFNVAHSTICHWKDDGIPARHWPLLLDVARRLRFRLRLDDIVAHSPLAPKAVRKTRTARATRNEPAEVS